MMTCWDINLFIGPPYIISVSFRWVVTPREQGLRGGFIKNVITRVGIRSTFVSSESSTIGEAKEHPGSTFATGLTIYNVRNT
jgi:hypothetical protein